MNIDYHLIIFAIVALYSIGTAIFRFFKWAGQQVKGGAAGANAVRQAPPLAQAAPPARTPPTRPVPPPTARPMPRQPQAGGPAVFREATERDFERQEEDLVASEPTGLGTPLRSPTRNAAPRKRLFDSSDDLVRAIILREALGPPLSRRRPPAPP